jgi:tetratricopeptide (TPR) repeat protein
MRRVAEQRFTTALRTGRLQEAQDLLIPWLTTDEPDNPETRAWERLSQFELLMLQDKLEDGLKLLKRNLTNRNGLSSDVFLWSVSHAMRPLYLLDRTDEARKYQRQAMPLLKDEPTDALGAGAHIAFLSRTGRIEEAVQVFEEFIQPGMEAPDPDAHFRIFAASAGLFEKLCEQGPSCQLKLPDCHPQKRSDETYDCEALRCWFESEARRIGEQFDLRNGNDYFLGRLYHYYNY